MFYCGRPPVLLETMSPSDTTLRNDVGRKQSDLDLSAFGESKRPEQRRGNSSQPRFQRDLNPDDGTCHDGKAQKLASERCEAMLEHQHARWQLSEYCKECMAFCASSLNGADDTEELQRARETTRLLATSRRLDLVRLKKLSTFAVAVILAPVGAEDVTTANRLQLGQVLTLSTVVFMFFRAVSGILLIFAKRRVKANVTYGKCPGEWKRSLSAEYLKTLSDCQPRTHLAFAIRFMRSGFDGGSESAGTMSNRIFQERGGVYDDVHLNEGAFAIMLHRKVSMLLVLLAIHWPKLISESSANVDINGETLVEMTFPSSYTSPFL
ncbi:hypothetical protein KC361_g243 [Hortaea werneckii]|nr:hypothetical protein KC361_g243 [Hortaea werneckii]